MTQNKRGWKKAIQDRARKILNAAEFRTAIQGADDLFLRELIAIHPEAVDKIGVGVDYFEVRPNEWKSRTFWLVRFDGSATDFSFLKAITPSTPMQKFAHACREAVVNQILEFKRCAFELASTIACPITGEVVTWDTAHIDHDTPTFDEIMRQFAATRSDIEADVEPTHDGELTTYFREEATRALFAEFHRKRAVLRVVSRRANLSVLKRKSR